jgi:hypothetical protein
MCQRAKSTANLPRRLCLSVLCLATAAGTAQAGEIYKSVDADGKVVYSDHLDPSMSKSSLVQLEDPGFPPSRLHFCWTNCFALILDNGVYRRTDGADETWTVETFSTNGIVLHRHDAPADWNGYSADVVYAGQVSNDRLIGVTVNGKPTSGIDASWGSALNTLPGSNAERDAPPAANLDSSSSDSVSSAVAPPPLPEEDQPPLPQDDYLWTPGYWSWRGQRYFWIPGAWVRPPQVGVLWTPGYWSSAGTFFVFHPGHWGPTVGFYGGVNYGYGYFGSGYSGGHWIGNSFAYNTAVNHVNPAVVNHSYAESVPGQGSRGVSKSQSQARVVTKPATPTTAERTSEPTPERTPVPMKVNTPTPVAKPPAPSTPAKSNHSTPIPAAPVKQ